MKSQKLRILFKIALAAILILGTVEGLSRALIEQVATPSELQQQSNLYFLNAFGFPDFENQARSFYSEKRRNVYQLNSTGYRSTLEMPPKGKEEIRIVVLGGSFVFDPYLSQGWEWTSKLERELRSEFPDVTVWNRGVPRATSYVALLRAVSELPMVEPDIVIYTGSWNDFQYFSATKSILSLALNEPRMNYFIKHAGPVDAFLSENSRAFNIMRTTALKFFILQKRVNVQCAPGTLPPQPLERPAPEAVEQYSKTLKALQVAVENLGALPVLAVEPNFFYAWNQRHRYKMPADFSECLTQRGVYESLLKTQEVTLSLKGASRPVFDPTQAFAGSSELLYDHLHLSFKGGDLYAKMVSQFLKPLIQARAAQKNKKPRSR